jgi:hypothetical protein
MHFFRATPAAPMPAGHGSVGHHLMETIMADYICEATGVLLLNKVTPVIEALFQPLKLDPKFPGSGQALIATDSKDGDPSWSDVHRNLPALAASLSLETRHLAESDLPSAFRLLAAHFGVDNDPVIADLFKSYSFDGSVDLETLFRLAYRFDDGHGLTALKLSASRYANGQELFPFGGTGFFISEELFAMSNSDDALSLGEDLYAAIRSDDLDKGAARIADAVQSILNSISDPAIRKALHWRLADLLLVSYQDSSRHS